MRILLIIILMLCLASPAWLYAQQVCCKDACFDVEVVNTPLERDKGLMDRETLDQGNGMLFVFDQTDTYCFWMKNMKFPLDIIWLNKDKEVVYIQENAQPCKSDFCLEICPEKKAMYVLELNSGICESLGLKLGDRLIFD